MGMLLDLFRNKWPYTDFHELNADWIISTVRQLIEAMDSFIQNESISFADPITWNITSQYAKATVVIDSAGNAYLSKQAVPAGIQLNNSEYWQEIFNFTNYTRTANRNLTFNVETDTTRATAAYNVDDWLILNDVLYRVTQAIAIDDTFIVAPASGSNIVHFTVEDFIKAWITSATALINQYKNDIDASELAYRQQLAQDIANITASLQAQLNAAIAGATVDSEVINARIGWNNTTYSTLGEAIRTQITELHSEIDNTNAGINGTNGILDYMPAKPFIITSSGIWQNAQAAHLVIPVHGGDSAEITANDTQSAVYAALVSDNSTASGVVVDFCANTQSEVWQERKTISMGQTVNIILPDDCNLLYITIHPVNQSQILLPKSIKINGVEYCYNIRERIDELTVFSADMTEIIPPIRKKVKELDDLSHNAFDIWGLRRSLSGNFNLVTLPSYQHIADLDLSLFSDGYSFKHTIDLRKYKNVSSNEYEVSTNAQLTNAINSANAGDTIYIADGVYNPISFNKSLNLIGSKNTIFASATPGAFESTQSPVVYKSINDFALTSDMIILDITLIDDGIIIPLQRVANTSQVIATKGSYVVSGNKLYVHCYSDDVIPTANNIIAITDNNNAGIIRSTGVSTNAILYLENIKIFGGSSCLYGYATPSYPDQKIIAYNCHFGFSFVHDAVMLRGCNGYFQNCICEHAAADGFNYHYNNADDDILSNGLEVDCISHDNGLDDLSANPSNNGSTIHDGGKIVRINGVYFNNNGGNVADTSPNTESYNYGCIAFDSAAPFDNTDQTSADFWCRYANMYLFGCRGIGDSQYNLRTDTYGHIYANKSEYDSHIGNIVTT